jgi:ABC-type antimicrobial peptide transport system permease subunit
MRLLRQLMAENLLRGILGAAAGLVVGYVAAQGLLYLMEAPPDLNVVTDWRMIVAGGALAIFSALLFGLAPARHAVRKLSPARLATEPIGQGKC